MGKRDKTKKNIQFDKSSKDDYGIDSGFSRIKKYRGENNYQTKTGNNRQSNRDVYANNSGSSNLSGTITSIDRSDYYNLDDKITSLSDKNIEAHDNLRKSLEDKINKVDENVDDVKKAQKSFLGWFIGIMVTVSIAFCTWLYDRLSLSSENKERIIKIESLIENQITPTLNNHTIILEKLEKENKSKQVKK